MTFEMRSTAPTARKALPLAVTLGQEEQTLVLTPNDGIEGTATWTYGLVLSGVGLASFVASIVTGGLYLIAKSDVDAWCEETEPGGFECLDKDGPAAAARGRTLGFINAITLAGGVVAGGVGVTLLLLDDHQQKLGIGVDPAGLSLKGDF